MEKIIKIEPDGRWNVLFKDEGSWRVGVYKPEFDSHEKIDLLEKHTCPELFICCGGRMGILAGFGRDERIMELNPGEVVLIEDYHNGFFIDENGYFMVVERTAFTTEYIERESGRLIKTVNV
jgi:hypothetical protein